MPFQHYLYSKNRAHNTGTCTGTFSKISCGLRAVFWKHLFPTSSFLRTNRTQVQLNTVSFRKLPLCTLPKNMYIRMRFITNVQKQGWRKGKFFSEDIMLLVGSPYFANILLSLCTEKCSRAVKCLQNMAI